MEKAFIRPTPREVEQFCEESNICIDAEYFCDYYESNGWMVGRTKMKSWKAAVRCWYRRQNASRTQKPKRKTDWKSVKDSTADRREECEASLPFMWS
jgi:hypothetical protein